MNVLRGLPDHPLHPPLTDVTIGSFTLGTVLVLASWAGIWEREAVGGGLLAIVVGLVCAVPTIATGFVDYLAIPRGIPRWRTATIHWLATITATCVFVVAGALLQDGFDEGRATAAGALCALGGELVLVVGGWLGGTMVFVHGERVLDAE